MMSENVFIALDLAGEVRGIALCDEAAGVGPESPGWLVRSRIRRLHSWIGSADPSRDLDHTRRQVLAAIHRWQIPPHSMRLVLLSHAEAQTTELAEALGITWLCVPQSHHVISPRGIAPAVAVKDYVHPLSPPAKLDLRAGREAFVPMMERAADDVQSDGLEQDDSFLDRYAEISIAGEPGTMLLPMETLTDEAWLLEAWQQAHADWQGRPLDPTLVELVALRLRCVVGAPDHGFRPGAGAQESISIRVPAGWRCEKTPMGHVLCRRGV